MTKTYINWGRDIFPEIKKQLKLYTFQQIPVTLRGMFYILVSLNVLGPEKQITLKNDFDWFLSEEFEAVRKKGGVCVIDNNTKEDTHRGDFSYSYSLPLYYSENAYPVRIEKKKDIYEEYKRDYGL